MYRKKNCGKAISLPGYGLLFSRCGWQPSTTISCHCTTAVVIEQKNKIAIKEKKKEHLYIAYSLLIDTTTLQWFTCFF